MAKITITLTDKRGGAVNCAIHTEPALKRGKKATPAMVLLSRCIDAMSKASEETNVISVDGRKVDADA